MKDYPDHTLENGLRERGIPYRVLWEMKGPKDTAISWLAAYLVGSRVVIVQTYAKGHGWDVYLPSQVGKVEETIEEVIAACVRKAEGEV